MRAIANQEKLIQVIQQITTSLNIDIQEYVGDNGEFNAESFIKRVNQLNITDGINID